MTPRPDAAYFLDHYGMCAAEKCACRAGEWLGRRCVNWRTFGATNADELGAAQRRLKQ